MSNLPADMRSIISISIVDAESRQYPSVDFPHCLQKGGHAFNSVIISEVVC